MKTSTIVWFVVIVLVVLGGWLLWSTAQAPNTLQPANSLGTQNSPNQTNTGQPSVPPVVTVATDPKLGNHLVAENGMTLYVYADDTAGVSKCTGSCAAVWPAYSSTTTEPLVAGGGANGLLSTITRTDGKKQLTYNGAPLYFYKNDKKAGDVSGQGIGGVWSVVAP